ncbi:MAG: beta strand repeat-containing protein, partial [Cetobacterium sp.]
MGTKVGLNRYIALLVFFLNSIFLLSAPVIDITKSNLSGAILGNTYDNGEQILYKVRVTNPDSTALNNIKVSVPLSLLTTSKEGGGTGLVYSNLINQVRGTSVGANAGTIPTSGDFLASGVDIPAGGYVEYYVLGTVNPLINGSIITNGTVTNNSGNTTLAIGSNTLTRIPYTYTLVKSSPLSYYEKDGSVTYKVTVTNTGSTVINDFSLVDNLPTELTGATITGTSTGGSNLGSFSTSGNLIATGISITPGNKVEYTITATVKPGVVGAIANTATATVRNQTENSNTVTLNLATYDFSIQKTASPANYTPNQNLTYKVKILNNSTTVPITKMKIDDILSTITATSANGSAKSAFDPTTVTVTATFTGSSNSGTFNSSGDLNATDVTIAPNSYVEYTIIGKVNADISGPISNTAKATDRNGVEKTSTISSTSVAPTLAIAKTQNKTIYLPGDTIVYTITLDNTGLGIATNYLVEDLLASITGNVGNAGTVSATNINPSALLENWSVSAVLAPGSTKSTSAIISNGGTTSNVNLLDVVTVFPGERITYTITTKAKDSSIGNIVNKVDLKKNSIVEKTSTVTTTASALASNGNVLITKVPTETEYKPGDIITYTITVKNPSNGFMDNLAIKDIITSITATQIDGSTGPAFDSWDLSVLSISGTGTVPGTGSITNATGDLILTADIGPNGSIVYQIKAKTKLTTVGIIKDEVTTGGDNVPESGPGVKMSTPLLEVAKNVNTTEYVPGGTLTYTIDVDNPGDGYATNVRVEDKLSAITALLIDGTTGPAYQSWTISSKIYDISSGSPVLVTSPSDPTSAGTYNPTGDIAITNAILGPNRRVTYTINAVLNPKAKGNIKNLARVNDAIYSDKGSQTRDAKISIAKSALTTTYASGNTTTVQYEVVVSNSATAGVALGVKVEDKISDIQATLLNGSGSINPFSNWTISAPILVGPETKTTITGSLSNVNLSDTVDISPGGSVKYTITGTLKTPNASEIAYGTISNTAKADTLTSTATITPKLPNLVTSKTADSAMFIPGNTVSFKVKVANTGDGYANDARVKDFLNSTYFEDISISASSIIGTGTTSGITGTINTNLDAIVDIAPGGSIEYTIVARVKLAYLGNTVSNTVEVTDTQNNLTTTTSATITKNVGVGNQIDFVKRSDSSTFQPGGQITYFIDVRNRLALPRTVTVKDLISSIKATYANDLSVDNVTDMPNQQAFVDWKIYKGENNSNPTTLFSSSTDLNDLVTISANSTMTYKIVGNVSDRVVTPQLTNIATLLEGTTEIGTSSVQHNIIPPGGGITRVVDKARYIPGVDTIKYTITVDSTGPGYQNNVSINELIKNLTVPLIDGTTGNPFQDPVSGNYNFTVKKIPTGETDGTEEVFTSGIANNENLVGIVDVKQGEKLQYVIEGVVRKDAIGTINNNGLITEPFRHNLQNTKNVSPAKYEPGQYITYTITIRNNSNGNAQNILVTDNFNTISVIDSTGATITPALTDITVDLPNSTATGFKADLGSPTIVAGQFTATPDIPTGGVIVYKIKAKVNEKAVGFITNTAIVDGDAVSNQVGPTVDKPEIKKEILNFYKPDGSLIAGAATYMPGGFIEYKVTLKNTGKGILNNGTFIDDLGAITTAYSTGTTGAAFDSWTITRVSFTGASTVPDINNSIVLNSTTTTGINALMDLHPGGEIIYTIKAKINEKAVGNITNIASLNGLKSTITTGMQSPTINHTKQAYEANGTTVKNNFLPGDTVVYKMRVENTGLGTSFLKTYRDLVSSIVGEIAETPGSPEAPTSTVFQNYTATFTTSGGNVTTVGTFNQTIDLPSMVTIAPGGWIEFQITGKLKDTLIGRFTNTSVYDNNTKTKVLNPVTPTITVKKTLTKLNGVSFTAGMTYAPGDSVEYEIVIENTGGSFYNDLRIGDNVDAVVTSLTGDANGKALENVVISAPTVTNTVSNPILTDIKSKPGDSPTNLQVEADLAPKDKIVYKINANIVKSAIGTIPANIANVGGTNYPSAVINPKSPTIVSKKELIAPANKIYGPNEVVEYKLTIENTGEGFGNDIKIIDEISKIKTQLLNGTLGQAFTSWTITSVITHGNTAFNGQTILQNTLVDNTDINTEVDIAPTGKVEITIKATTSSLAAGEIINIAKINNVDKSSDPINPRTAVVEFLKLPLVAGNTTYTPNGDIGFRLVLTNTSNDAIAKDINLTDIISGITVQSSAGGTVPAFQPGWTLEQVIVSGNTSKFSTTGIGATGDITAGKVTLGPGETLVIRIKGKANNTAVGDIINTANASYNGVNLGPKTVTLTPLPGTADLTKTVNKTEYTPGGELLYTIVVKNTGAGYLDNISIIDDLKLITTELANGTTGQAITAVTQVTLAKTNPATSIIQDSTYVNGYKATGDIYPGDTVTIVLKATVNPLAAGKIINVAKVNDSNNNKLDDDTKTVNPLPADVKILKTVDKSVYISGDTLTYKVVLGNTGTGWANGIKVTDMISEIKAKINNVDTPAFASWSISWVTQSGSAQPAIVTGQVFPINNTTSENLNASVSLAPMSGIEFTIVGKLKANTTTDIKNIAKYKYDPANPTNPGTPEKSSNEVITSPKISPLTIGKKQNNPRENSGFTENPVKYWLSDTIEYEIKVTNGDTATSSFDIIDNIKDILVFGSGGNNIAAFSQWKIKSVSYTGGTPVGNATIIPAIGAVSTTDNIKVTTGLEAGETVTIIIEAKITAGVADNFPQSVIKNIASINQSISGNNITQNSNEVIFTPYPPVLTRSKSITSIGGVAYTPGMTYEPGQ